MLAITAPTTLPTDLGETVPHSLLGREGLARGANRVRNGGNANAIPADIQRAGPDRTHVATLRGIAQHDRGKRPFGPA
jgi:hypothetical protein